MVEGQPVELPEAVMAAAALVDGSAKIVVLTGAGISTDSRIPDYRGPKGVWTRNPEAEKQSTIQNYVADPEIRKRAWRSRLDSPLWGAEPNRGHLALTHLETRRKLHLLITQNVDGLHHDAGSSHDSIVEVHGTAREAECLGCEWRVPMVEVLNRVRLGEDDPDCPDCGGIVKSATISFGQSLVDDDLRRAQDAAETADLVLAIGSTLAVHPIANVVPLARYSGASVLIVNGQATEMDGLANVIVRGSISDVVPTIVGLD